MMSGFQGRWVAGGTEPYRGFWRGVLHATAVLGLALVAGGCDGGSFVPPRPAGLGDVEAGPTSTAGAAGSPAATGAGAVSPSARGIELIVGSIGRADAVEAISRSQAGMEGVRIHISFMGADGSLANLVDAALSRNPISLIIDQLDATGGGLSGAVAAARDKSVPVIVIDRPHDGATVQPGSLTSVGTTAPNAGPLISVAPESFRKSAEQLVQALVKNAINGRLKPQDGAVLMINTTSDPLHEDRARAIRDALGKEGVKPVLEVQFPGSLDLAKEKLKALLRDKPGLGMVISTDHIGLTASSNLVNELVQERPFVVAGFSHDESGAMMTQMGQFAALAVYSPERLLRKAITVAAAAGRGQKQPESIPVIIPFHMSPGSSGIPKVYMPTRDARSKNSPKD